MSDDIDDDDDDHPTLEQVNEMLDEMAKRHEAPLPKDNVVKIKDFSDHDDDKNKKKNVNPDLGSIDAAVDYLNKDYSAVMISGKFRVIKDLGNNEFEIMGKRDFIDSLENKRVRIISSDGFKIIDATKIWFQSPNRNEYDEFVFDPSEIFDPESRKYNTWRGFAITPERGHCHRFLHYVKNVICSGNKVDYRNLICWCAHLVQRPYEKPGFAIVLKGLKGIGKSFFAERLGELLDGRLMPGKQSKLYFVVSKEDELFGSYNEHLEKVLLLVSEEASWAGNRKDESRLKDFITRQSITINPKFLPARVCRNYSRLMILGNNDWLVPASSDERRFFAMEVSSEYKDNKNYFDALYDEWNSGGAQSFMGLLQGLDISEWNSKTAPNTKALSDQKVQSFTGVKKWWMDILLDGRLPFADIRESLMIKSMLYENYLDCMKRTHNREILSNMTFGIQFNSLLPNIVNNQIVRARNQRCETILKTKQVRNDPKYAMSSKAELLWTYVMPDLTTCRRLMSFAVSGSYDSIDWSSSDAKEWDYLDIERNPFM